MFSRSRSAEKVKVLVVVCKSQKVSHLSVKGIKMEIR